MDALGLHDRVEADAGVGEGPAHCRSGAGAIGHTAHGNLGLIPIEGYPPHGGIIAVAGLAVVVELLIAQFKGFGRRAQGFGALVIGNQTAHLDLAGGDQAQVDAAAGQGVKQAGGYAGAAHDPGPGDAELGHAALGRELGQVGSHGRQHFTAHELGPIELMGGQGKSDVVGAPLMGGLHD